MTSPTSPARNGGERWTYVTPLEEIAPGELRGMARLRIAEAEREFESEKRRRHFEMAERYLAMAERVA